MKKEDDTSKAGPALKLPFPWLDWADGSRATPSGCQVRKPLAGLGSVLAFCCSWEPGLDLRRDTSRTRIALLTSGHSLGAIVHFVQRPPPVPREAGCLEAGSWVLRPRSCCRYSVSMGYLGTEVQACPALPGAWRAATVSLFATHLHLGRQTQPSEQRGAGRPAGFHMNGSPAPRAERKRAMLRCPGATLVSANAEPDLTHGLLNHPPDTLCVAGDGTATAPWPWAWLSTCLPDLQPASP